MTTPTNRPPRRPPPAAPPVPPPAPPVAAPTGWPVVVNASPPERDGTSADGRRARRRFPWAMVIVMLLAAVAAGGGLAYVVWPRGAAPQRLLARIDDQNIDELTQLKVELKVLVGDEASPVKLSLKDAPVSMKLDEENRLITWTPSEAQGPDKITVVVVVECGDDLAKTDQRKFSIIVNEVNQAPQIAPIGQHSVVLGEPLQFPIEAKDLDEPADTLRYRLAASGGSLGATIDPVTGVFNWTPRGLAANKAYDFEVRVVEQGRGGLSATQPFQVTVTPPERPVVQDDTPKPPRPVEPPVVAAPPEKPVPEDLTPEDEKAIYALYEANKLLDRREYPTLRKLYAARFERDHGAKIKQGLGTDYDKVVAWLNEHGDMKEELFTAIDPQADQMPRVFRLLADLIEKYPNEATEFGELAIATAVVWDNEHAIYDYKHHQMRTKATLPEGQLAALENFHYYVMGDRVLQRVRFMPWEFLVHVVDHRTPLDERRWAVGTYLSFRAGYGRCYKDVPYDYDMLKSEGKQTRLEGKPYTLEALKACGGVCAMQADYASRVGKCMAVPAAYVAGEARSGDRHAWVMWVELKGISKDHISFSLESNGRYFGDRYYVGTLKSPQTGRTMTDRQLELRLHTVGLNPLAKRHAALVMKSFPMLRQKAAMDLKTELAFLNNVIQLCPGNEDAWRSVAALSKDDRIEKPQAKAMALMLDKLFQTFAAFPDFTWVVFDDLIAFQKDSRQRGLLYGRLVALYEQAGRPDLACEARLKYADQLVAENRHKEAVEGLAFTIKKFPDEGRYVPKMLDKIEAAAKDFDKTGESLMRFYQEFLPLVPATRGERPSPYCIDMHRRAADVFRKYNRLDLAQMCEARATQLQALGKGP